MRTLTLRNRFQGNTTSVENDFIDNYMTKANGEYVKVYLLLLRHMNACDCSLSISKLADCLECPEKDILRAFKHWSKVGLLKIDYDETGVICGLDIGIPNTATPADVTVPAKPAAKAAKQATPPKADLKQLYFVIEQYLGKPLSKSGFDKINYFYDKLHFSEDLIEYLFETCVDNGHKSMAYIESVALAWAEKGITTTAEAKEQSSFYNKNYFSVLKAFGISGRNPAPLEKEYMRKWFEDFGFALEIILEACNRTIANTAKPDFKYADSILTDWQNKSVRHLSDISALDLAHRQKATQKRAVRTAPTKPAQNRFNNFEGRSYDIHSLEQQILKTH